MTKKIVVPKGMLKAAILSAGAQYGYNETTIGPHIEKDVTVGLEAALRWLSENPIEPAESEWRESFHDAMRKADGRARSTSDWERLTAIEWQRRMFLSPEPEIPQRPEVTMSDNPDMLIQSQQVKITGPVRETGRVLRWLKFHAREYGCTVSITDTSVPEAQGSVTAPVPQKSHEEEA